MVWSFRPNFLTLRLNRKELTASMRQPIRPFITAYKSRSSKSRTSNRWDISEAESANANPSFDDPSVFAPPEIEHDAAYLAALKAADAVFGCKAAEVPEVAAPSIGLPGRVLPNLLQEDATTSLPVRAASKKTHRVRQPARVAKSVNAEPKKVKRQVAAVIQTPSVQPTIERKQETVLDTSHRARRAIQKKWVLKTELKAGEKWKRRLGKVAR